MRGKLPTPCKSLYAANVLQSLKGDAVKDSETPSWLCSYALFQSKCLYLEVFLLGKHDSTFFLHCASILSTFPLLAFLLFPPLRTPSIKIQEPFNFTMVNTEVFTILFLSCGFNLLLPYLTAQLSPPQLSF